MLKKYIKKISYVLLSIHISLFSANAYVDPGTGGMIIGSFWSYLVALIAIIAGFIATKFLNPIKRLFKKKNRKNGEKN